jgi:hypothetical protein
MAKKPRSQRRKKGTGLGEDGGDDMGSVEGCDLLSDSHTIAASETEFTVDDGAWNAEDDFGGGGGADDEDALINGTRNSLESSQAAAEARRSKLLDTLSQVGEIPSEKRSAKREAGLKHLFRALAQYATGSVATGIVEAKVEDILAACKFGLRGGTPSEQYAACRVLEVTSIVLGPDPTYFDSAYTILWRVVQMKSKAVPVRIAALRAITMANFIGGNDDVSSEQLMDSFELLAAKECRGETVPSLLRAAALDCWALLSTTVQDLYIAGKDDFSTGRGLLLLKLLQECLDEPNVQLRSAAGECVALIHEARLKLGLAQDEGENTTERKFRRGTWVGSDWEEIIDEIQQRISELSVESGHRMSKKAKKEQRATFREFQATIVDDEAPQEVVNFRGGTLQLESWSEIVQLNFIRHCLQGGFQIQLLTNSTLQDIFGADGTALNEFGGYSQLEKRLLLSKTSEVAKLADQDMTKRRRNRTNVKNHFLTSDGEDL